MKVPEGVSVEVRGNVLRVKGPKATLEKQFDAKTVSVKAEASEVAVTAKKKPTRKTRAAVNAVEAHLKNMSEGCRAPFAKKLQVVYAHFPVSIEVKEKTVLIKNFLGEKTPREAAIVGETAVAAAGQEVTVSGSDKEAVGQTAANLVRATKITGKDIRVFQDGIYYSED
ncbi:MAG: 50S ribosomal protein L6 [Candidatus Micrarchaeota archaeon]